MLRYLATILLAGISIHEGALLDHTDHTDHRGLLCDRAVDVAIIGAGPAGMYAAYRLRRSGQVMELLEYSNRIGGRLHTTFLPDIPDIPIELGAMRFIDGLHTKVQHLVEELNLATEVFQPGLDISHGLRYFLRGKHLTMKQIADGDVPYNLSAEEKDQLPNILGFYLEKLTGFSGSLTPENVLKLTTKDGQELYKLTIQEALKLVATSEGIAYLQDSISHGNVFMSNVTAVELFLTFGSILQQTSMKLTLTHGMDSLVKSMARAFLQSSDSHAVTLNRKLEAISGRTNGFYQLQFSETLTENGLTHVQNGSDFVCARKVILAIPQLALTLLNWKPLRKQLVKEALQAVIPFPASKVYFSFSNAWWLQNTSSPAYIMKSDLPFTQMYDWRFSNVSGSYVMLASYADCESTINMQELNSNDCLDTSSPRGANHVTDRLKEQIMNHLAQAFGIRRETIPEPANAISYFWADYPYQGAVTAWKAGYNYNNVKNIIQHPSLLDDVYIVGSDRAFLGLTYWIEGALTTVDDVLHMYFSST